MKSKEILLFLVFALLLGCSEDKRIIHSMHFVCEKGTINQRSSFILQCIANANPKSDEETEDWIRFCPLMADQIYCDKKPVIVIQERVGLDPWRDTSVNPPWV